MFKADTEHSSSVSPVGGNYFPTSRFSRALDNFSHLEKGLTGVRSVSRSVNGQPERCRQCFNKLDVKSEHDSQILGNDEATVMHGISARGQ